MSIGFLEASKALIASSTLSPWKIVSFSTEISI